MKIEEFETQMQRLVEVYSKGKYPDQRMGLFWEKFKLIPLSDFKNAVSTLIANEQYAPMLAKFEALLREELETSHRDKTTRIIKTHGSACFRCSNKGFIELVLKDQIWASGHVFKCRCELGAALYPRFPLVPKNFGNEYTVKFSPEYTSLYQNRDKVRAWAL